MGTDPHTDCVDVCPVDAFRAGKNMLVIDPHDCIDCALCISECPVDAIYVEEDVPADQQPFIDLNARLAPRWPVITKTRRPPPDADDWAKVEHKMDQLDERADNEP